MVLQIDIAELPNKNDLLSYDGRRWVAVNPNKVLYDVMQKITEFEQKITELKEVDKKINDKLKEYHEILQLLTGGK